MPQLGVGRGAVAELDGCLFWNHGAPYAWRADDHSRQRRQAAEHLLCRQQLPLDLLPGEPAPLVDALIHQPP